MKKNLTIIGLGNIGEVFARELKYHFNVTTTNRSDKSKLAKALGVAYTNNISKAIENADYVILAVPIEAFSDVIGKIKAAIPSTAIVMDTCAVKELPLKMMSKLPCKIMGTHPQFRNIKSVKGKSIILVGSVDDYFKKILQKIGLRIKIMSAKKHDEQMAIVNLVGFIGLSLIKFLSEKERVLLKKHAGTASRNLVNLLERMEENSLSMYEDIQRANPSLTKLRKKIIKSMSEYNRSLNKDQIK